MSVPPNFTNPEEVIKAFNQQASELLGGFASSQAQEMVKEFSQAWNAIAQQAMENPQEWLQMMAKYQQEQLNLWGQLFNVNVDAIPGITKLEPERGDRRFSAKEWNENPVFDYIKQSYLLASKSLTQWSEYAHLDEENKRKLEFYTKYFIDAMSPTNFAVTNPEVMREAVDSKGQSLLNGLRNLLEDMGKGRITMTDESAFELGKNIGASEGAVVYQNRMMQLIQYKPTTEKVSDRPLLIVPPSINKFYILDLQPANSFVKYAVDQGNTVFLISWVNPDESMKDTRWDDYLEDGIIEATKIIQEITGAKKLNTVSWCVGGTLLSSALAVMHAKKMHTSIASATFFTTMLDFTDVGDLRVFIDEGQVAQREAQLKQSGILSGKDLALAFSMIRANDLIWSYVVNNYLKGQSPAPFDILYWNSDPTNLPANMYSDYLRNLYLENKLIQKNALEMCGVPIDLTTIKTPSYFLSTIDDHIAPWKSTFTGTELFSGSIEFVLGASGHIAGVINPPAKNKRNFWHGGELGKGCDHWLETAKSEKGSWWNHWSAWLKKRGGTEVAAPAALGNDKYKELEAAPGSYVKERIV
ncbi:class I poly(R)-hydroxyalkanoic acid synthase [Candidatus Albibeggiatoa sp. nov. NOAA]|uniref:PHA/PHB synthase family protein n=1 Tax=Candidatus Albibeggiatoa sp. nov. NOAA TaxID=3162724 RepID=UPI003301F482|nr:class I poly(R)-hydroxyalkanoic acid synthase [Thiotrichaceae bacterium]